MKMSELIAHAEYCIANKLPLSILVQEPRQPLPEQITHPFENIPSKMEYYKIAFDEDCKRESVDGMEIVAVVDASEPAMLIGEAISSPYTSPLRKNHVRVEDGYVIDSREKQIVIEGRVEDVMQVLKYIKAGESND